MLKIIDFKESREIEFVYAKDGSVLDAKPLETKHFITCKNADDVISDIEVSNDIYEQFLKAV